jgi:hypothetical protein
MKVEIPAISGISFYNNDYMTISYNDGQTVSVPINDYRSNPDQQATLDLGNLGIPNTNIQSYVHGDITCDSCKKQYGKQDIGFRYDYIKYSRNICRHCLVVALDKMLGLDVNGNSERVLFST